MIYCFKITLQVDCLQYYRFQFYIYVLLRLPNSLNSFRILNIMFYNILTTSVRKAAIYLKLTALRRTELVG